MQSRDFEERGVPVLNVGCVQWGKFDESKLDYLPMHKASAFERYRILPDDLLFTRSGTVGRCAIATARQHGYLMTFHLLRVRPTRMKCLPKYLQFVFQGATHIQRQTTEAAIGSTRAGFNTNLLANLDVPLPPLVEQEEIVRCVEALFRFADQIEARYQNAQAFVDKLTQSILAKAFRGELVPTEAELAHRGGRNYEPASVPVERTREERCELPIAPRRTRPRSG
jgi:type I restriction enzyme S subunit